MSTARTLGNIGDTLTGTSNNTTTFSGNVSVSGNITTSDGTQFNTANSLGTRNRIMNGAFTVWQRGTSATLANGAGSDVFCADRWVAEASNGGGNATGGTVVWSQSTVDSTMAYGSPYYMNITCTSFAGTGSVPNSQLTIFQRIEAANIYDLAGKTVTLSFYSSITSASGGTFVGNIYLGYPPSVDSGYNVSPTYIGPITFSPTATPQKFTITTTLASGFQNGCVVYIRAVNTGTTASTVVFNIGSVQLEQGTIATPFERRPYGLELSLCQRYYWRAGGAANAYPTIYGNTFGATAAFGATIGFPVQMRAAPTVTKYGTWTISGSSSQPVVDSIDKNGFLFYTIGSAANNVKIYPADATTYIDALAEI